MTFIQIDYRQIAIWSNCRQIRATQSMYLWNKLQKENILAAIYINYIGISVVLKVFLQSPIPNSQLNSPF